MSNLLTLCGAHHEAVHEGRLVIEACVDKLAFRHADGTPYGSLLSALVEPVQARALRALRGLGFAEKDVRLALRQALGELPPRERQQADGAGELELELVLRHALQLLTEHAWQRAS